MVKTKRKEKERKRKKRIETCHSPTHSEVHKIDLQHTTISNTEITNTQRELFIIFKGKTILLSILLYFTGVEYSTKFQIFNYSSSKEEAPCFHEKDTRRLLAYSHCQMNKE
jgi:hypothetical protein